MRIVRTIEELRAARSVLGPVALVPTMGNLHAGHLALLQIAKGRADHVAATIFVNRLQFTPSEDFDSYPRTFDADCEQLRAGGVDLLFAPEEQVLYPRPQTFVVEPPAIADELEGAFRPRFFHGVATVVLKLFNCVQPQFAVFGKKDYQQLVILRGMAAQLNLPVEIVEGETIREADGVAMSSRNTYLSPLERNEAPRLIRELTALRDAVIGGRTDFTTLEKAAMESLAGAGWNPDYVALRRRTDLAPATATDRSLVVLGAARLGGTRLIDNLELEAPQRPGVQPG
jgi:pantoate--beta-alanine ligase